MAIPPERKVIVIDGVTNAGKTTAINILRKQMPGCTQVKFSDYYHKSMQRAVGKVGQVDFSNAEVIDRLVGENLKRYANVLQLARESPLDDYLIERLHPTDYVYRQVLFSRNGLGIFNGVEEILNRLGAYLLVLTLDDQTLLERSESTLAYRCRKEGASFEVPQHILSHEENLRKRDLYLDFYSKSRVERKMLMDTSKIGLEELGGLLSLTIPQKYYK